MTDDDRSDPGPHTCVYVGTDTGDECEICGRDSDPFRDLPDDWAYWNWRDEENGYDLGGEAGVE